MNQLELRPFSKPVSGIVTVPGSKSITNRALLLAALASNGATTIRNAIFSDDSRYFLDALRTLGFAVEVNSDAMSVRIEGLGGKIPSTNAELFIGNAGTAARFLTAFLALGHGTFVIDGEPRMRQRPIGDLIEGLRSLSVSAEGTIDQASGAICPPVTIHASGLEGGRVAISGKTSSQYISALMMVAPLAREGLRIEIIDQLNSRPYVDLTATMMRQFGAQVNLRDEMTIEVPSGKYRSPIDYRVEPDASAASYFLAIPALVGGSVTVSGLSERSLQGDVKFAYVLRSMGMRVEETKEGITASFPREQKLGGITVNMADIPDTAQTLAALAPFASSPVEIRGIASARVKESDRVSATCAELRKCGVLVEEFEDGMRIHPCEQFKPAVIDTYKDHRMAMSFALIGMRVPGIVINDPTCVNKTFPDYFHVLESLRA